MGDHDDGQGAIIPELAHQHVYVGADAGVQSAEGLVQQQHLWPRHQGLRQRKTLLHTAGQLGGIFIFRLREAHGCDQLMRKLERGLAVCAEQLSKDPACARGRLQVGANHDIAKHREMGKHGIALKHDATISGRFR